MQEETINYQLHQLHQAISQLGDDFRELRKKVNQIEEKQLRDQKDVWFMIQELTVKSD